MWFSIIDMDQKTIEGICRYYHIYNWTLNGNKIDVKGDVNLKSKNLTKIPIPFGTVTGRFDCSKNSLKTLENCPIVVGKDFNCENNKLTDLNGCPIQIGGSFHCYFNELKNNISTNVICGDFFTSVEPEDDVVIMPMYGDTLCIVDYNKWNKRMKRLSTIKNILNHK